MGRYNFVGPMGPGNPIEEFFIQREMEERQRMLDAQRIKEGDAALSQRDRALDIEAEQNKARVAEREAAQADLEKEREFRRAATIHTNAMPGILDPDTAGLLKRQGFGDIVSETPPTQGADLGVDEAGVNQYAVTPGILQTQGGTAYRQARTAAEERAAQATAAQAAAAERAAADRASRESMAADGNATRAAIAQASAASAGQAAQQRADAANEKTAAAASAKAETDKAKADARSTIASLANDLAQDGNLSDITGMIEGRRDSFLLPGNAEAMRKFNELVNKIALERRGDLKGQGTISNYEAQQVVKAIGLDRTVGPDNLRKKILEIAGQYGGGQPMNTGGTVAMVAPDGRRLNVPSAKVAEMEALGAKRQ